MSKRVYQIYKNLFYKHGDKAASVKARTYQQQNLRFKYLFECAKITSSDSILDVGSGLGNLLSFIRRRKLKSKYTGIDFLEEFIKISKKKHHNDKNSKFFKFNILKQKIKKKYDWVILSGTFNDKYKDSSKDMLRIIFKMFSSCKKGIIFNSLSKNVDYEDKKLFYSHPDKVFDYCIKNLSKYAILKTDYQLKKGVIPFEYTICVKKRNEN
jgi:2-polyprenyl-3-methyl-5-hydroxy-6-metoxy-1,4-benzoquinol methylase